ncbi:MAG: hypothetical protein ACKVS8_12310 [Phycisphaerales bacterium]
MKRGSTNSVLVVSGMAVAAVCGGCAHNTSVQATQNEAPAVRSTLVSSYKTSAGVGDSFGSAVFQTPDLTYARLNNSMGPVYAQVRTSGE